MILKELIERELEQYLEWPTADRSHVTTASAKLFAEHVARLYADHIAEARKKVSRPQIREVFMRNGAVIPADRDDLPDYVYESVFELLEMAAPAVQGEPFAWATFDGEGSYDFRLYENNEDYRERYLTANTAPMYKQWVFPLYDTPQPTEQQPTISDEILARTTFGGPQRFTTAEQHPVAEVKYTGYASGNELVWTRGAGLQFLPEGTKLYAASIHVPTPVAYLDVGAGGYMDLGTDLTEDQVGSLPWGRHILAIVGTYGVDGYVPAEQQPADSADVRLDKQCRQDVAAALGFPSGGNYAWSYLLQQIKDAVSSEGHHPDVRGLMEALDITELRKLLLILRGNIGGAMWTLDDEEEELAVRTEKAIDAIAALAAYRKQGGGK